ncbi:CDP-glycerol glycerophosphotransferase family protein [Planococcus glaciei]|uniref:CDP-glycerol glycerophosphotransferase family protein n=1 Tax=Planococcus glaciei TaxID=459472 RepID=UPI001F20D98C|nr:CDP-glycerol glycerophosphotransferase family protein [Planococcus glaciei]
MKELVISIYLFLFKALFSLFSIFPLTNKTVFLSSFGSNAFFLAKELAKHQSPPVIFLNQKRCKLDFSTIDLKRKTILQFESFKLKDTLLSIYHLATAKYVFVDDYVAVLSAVRFRENVKCIQLWHAAGAVKKFGWSDPETSRRSERAKARFQKVYNQFHYIPVGSQKMADIFAESFHLGPKHFLYTGVPKTDVYFDTASKALASSKVKRKYPIIEGKKTVLYAPTFRKDTLHNMELQLDMEEMLEKLGEDFVILVRLHPAVLRSSKLPNHSRIISVSGYPHIYELLIASDFLVTDYSSIPVEFSLLRKKMIFFTYDSDSYSSTHGLWTEDPSYFPGPVVKTTAGVIEHILDADIDYDAINQFNQRWNTFSKGSSCRQLIEAIYGS